VSGWERASCGACELLLLLLLLLLQTLPLSVQRRLLEAAVRCLNDAGGLFAV
jgi:hypothetical protein